MKIFLSIFVLASFQLRDTCGADPIINSGEPNPNNDPGCPAAECNIGDPCNPSLFTDDCKYGAVYCPGITDPLAYITLCTCFAGGSPAGGTFQKAVAGDTSCPDPATICPTNKPNTGDLCEGSFSCRYDATSCPGDAAATFLTDCTCNGAVRRLGQLPARDLLALAQVAPSFQCQTQAPIVCGDPPADYTCPLVQPSTGDICTIAGEICRYDPAGCPGKTDSGAFLTSCTCESSTLKYACFKTTLNCSGGLCFSGESQVEVQGFGPTRMKDLKIGDVVQVGKDRYEPVYSFGHYEKSSKGNFLQIRTSDQSELQISPDHMIYVKPTGFIPASSVKEGNVLLNGSGEHVTVVTIRNVQTSGFFAPFTPSGKIVVNNILASSFVAFEGEKAVSVVGIPIPYQWLAQAFEFPHRLVCHYLGQCSQESYNEHGISAWVALPLEFFEWALRQNLLVRQAVLTLAASTFLGFTFVERCLLSPLLVAFITLVAIAGAMYRCGHIKIKTQ